jgi:tRNA (guanine26-N2/guanine27-N2)-dimethyltransferase
MIVEGSAHIDASTGKISKKLEVFYNPVMKLNRDLTVLLFNSIGDKDMQICLPLGGSGVRAVRIAKEVGKGTVKSIAINDISPKAVKAIRKNLKQNSVDAEVYNKDANLFLLESKGFDYIDIDPFGTPNPFLDASVVRLARGGILAVTATDTAALAGTSPQACKRKYWAIPLRNEFMHETAIRILIRKVQLIGAQHEKALTPMFSYYSDHYYRIFFRCDKGRKKVDELLESHKYLNYDSKTMERKVSEYNIGPQFAGPLWIGQLWDKGLVNIMLQNCDKKNQRLSSLISAISAECMIDSVGFYDLHKLSKLYKIRNVPIGKILGSEVSRTHFLGWGVRSSLNINQLIGSYS